MRATLCGVLIFSAALLAAQDATIEKIGKSPVETKFVSGGRIRMDLCSSGIDVIGKESGQLRVFYDAGRGNCESPDSSFGGPGRPQGDRLSAE